MKNFDNEFGLNKKKYKKEAVIDTLRKNSDKFNEQISELKSVLNELKSENESLKAELEIYKNKNSVIEAAIKDAEEKAYETNEKTELRYCLAIEELKRFTDKWKGYFDYLKQKYPFYPIVKKSTELRDYIKKISDEKKPREVVSSINEKLSDLSEEKDKPFDPKDIIKDYVAATSDNGFDLEEVLNPGELQLEDLCKELGLLE